MAVNKNQLIGLIKSSKDFQFTKASLAENNPWYFQQQNVYCDYVDFKNILGGVFKVTQKDVVLIGSGLFGMSLSPTKGFRRFSSKSDLDTVIVSPKYFEIIWSDFLKAYYAGYNQTVSDYGGSIFKKFITFDGKNKISTKWLLDVSKKNDEVKKVATTRLRLKHELKFRIYRSWDDVFAYQNWSEIQLRKKIE